MQNVRDTEGLKPRSRLGDRTGERCSASTKAGRLPRHVIIKGLGRTAPGVNSRCWLARSGQLDVDRRTRYPRGRAYSSGACHEALRGRAPAQVSHVLDYRSGTSLARLSWRQLLGRPEPLMPHWRRRYADSAPRAEKEPTSGRGKQQSSVEDPLRSAVPYVGRRVRSLRAQQAPRLRRQQAAPSLPGQVQPPPRHRNCTSEWPEPRRVRRHSQRAFSRSLQRRQ